MLEFSGKGVSVLLFHKGKTKNQNQISEQFHYDANCHKAILKCSICNGEQVAGFKDLKTGRFYEIMFIRSQQELQDFMNTYGLSDVTKEY